MQEKVISTPDDRGNSNLKTTENPKKALKLLIGILTVLIVGIIVTLALHVNALGFLKKLWMLQEYAHFLPSPGKHSGFGLLFMLGLLTSFHCLGMCGGIIISQTINDSNGMKRAEAKAWIYPTLLYNSGRVIAYTLVGAIIGGVGQAITLIGIWKGIVPFIGGLFMLIMGINLLGIFPLLRRFNLSMPSFAFKKIRSHHYGPFFIGILNGLMPCGPLQIVQLYALSTGSMILGALSMFCFAMGTVPLLFSFGVLSTKLNNKHTGGIMKISAILVMILGVVMMGRGLALSGVKPSPDKNVISVDTCVSHVKGNIQTVTTSIQSDRLPAIVVQKAIPVRWIMKVDRDNLNGCNHAITIPKLKIEGTLQVGENLIEFTPQETGDIIYTCWMGMIKSKITVVEDIKKLKFR